MAQEVGEKQGEMRSNPQPQTAFIWPIYADATLAGLSVLFPLPLIDWALEEHFRQRMPAGIARYHQQTLSPEVQQTLNQSRGCLGMSVLLIAKIPIKLVKRLSRKFFYVLSIKEASDKLSFYWQRAFLLNYMLQAGHLETEESAVQANQAMNQTLQSTPSPLTSLTKAIVRNRSSVFALLRGARQGKSKGKVTQMQTWLEQWAKQETFLSSLAVKYRDSYHERMPLPPPAAEQDES